MFGIEGRIQTKTIHTKTEDKIWLFVNVRVIISLISRPVVASFVLSFGIKFNFYTIILCHIEKVKLAIKYVHLEEPNYL